MTHRELLLFRVKKKTCVDLALIDLVNRLRVGGCSFSLISNALANCTVTRHHRRWKAYNCLVRDERAAIPIMMTL